MDVESTVDGDEGLRIPMEELLDELDEMTLEDGRGIGNNEAMQ
jgi:hypothetical protein